MRRQLTFTLPAILNNSMRMVPIVTLDKRVPKKQLRLHAGEHQMGKNREPEA